MWPQEGLGAAAGVICGRDCWNTLAPATHDLKLPGGMFHKSHVPDFAGAKCTAPAELQHGRWSKCKCRAMLVVPSGKKGNQLLPR